ncbi:helix-turn-helix domain-containing protein [Pyrodictium abyssi]|uniref:HTH arsR-type domain-containing protein n=1 Tax=Pyrodictium abyssi TaxID=54256 RepID=A0ABM8IWI5_9CREN|nr:hypothetical protein PABY_14950 [Pyrodictium abyssi]
MATDSYDAAFLEAFLGYYNATARLVYFLNSSRVLDELECGPSDVLVLLDPNIDDTGLAHNASERIARLLVDGCTVVATHNGLALLNLTLTELGYVVHSVDNVTVTMPGYNTTKYRYAYLVTPDGRVLNTTVWSIEVGKGRLVGVALNVVWAYADTRNTTYLELLYSALQEALSSPPRPGVGTAATAVGVAVAGSAAATLASSRAYTRAGTPRGGGGGGHTGRSGGLGGTGGAGEPEDALVVAPLRVKTEPSEMLEHPLRARMLQVLRERGAVHHNELMRVLGVSKATLRWHLYMLLRGGYIGSLRYKKYLVYFARGRELDAIRSLAARDEQFCGILQGLAEGVPLEVLSRRYRVSVKGLQDLSELVKRLDGKLTDVCREA